jgi:hypothetical protein
MALTPNYHLRTRRTEPSGSCAVWVGRLVPHRRKKEVLGLILMMLALLIFAA